MQSNWGLYESWRKSFQHKHAEMLRCYTPQITPSCKWIRFGEEIIVNGILLRKGCFYVGECFEIPKSYKKKRFEIDINQYNREYKLSRLFGPVIQKDLPIEKGEAEIVPFSSYIDMHPTHRYEYLLWLAEEINISEISSSTVLFYLFGLQLRMFIDDSTDEEERLELIIHTLTLYSQCLAYQVHTLYLSEFELFINAAIGCYFKGKEIEILNSNCIGLYDEIQEKGAGLLYAICYYIVREQKKLIPPILISKYFINNVKQFVESEINKLVNTKEDTIAYRSSYHSVYYSLVHPSGILSDSLLCYDLLLNIRLREEYQICYAIKDAIKYYSKETYAKLKEYRTINSISPTLSFFALPSTFNAYDYEGADTYVARLREKTENQEYIQISIKDILDIDISASVNEKLDKNQIISIIKCLKSIGYGIVPNYIVDETRFNYGDICIIYREANTESIDTIISRQFELLIKVCLIVIRGTSSRTDIEFIDNIIKNEICHVPTQKYLSAYLRWIMTSSYKLTKTDKNSIQELPDKIKNRYSIFATRIAIWNNLTIAKRIECLKEILPLFNVDSHTIHTFIHRVISDDEDFATIEKVTNASEYTIDKKTTAQIPSISLSDEQLMKVEKQTEQAQEILSDIFQEDEKSTEQTINKNDIVVDILSTLLSKESWQRSEVESLCQKSHLMIGYVLEQINEYSYNKIEDSVIEDDGDTIYVMTEYKDKLI